MTIIIFEFMKVIKWIAFWGIHQNGKDCLYKWKFLSFALKNETIEFQRVMDQVLVGLALLNVTLKMSYVFNFIYS